MPPSDFAVSFRNVPSAGPPRERTIGISVYIPPDLLGSLPSNPLSITIEYDNADGIPVYNELVNQSESVRGQDIPEVPYEYTALIPTKSTYNLRVTATLDTEFDGTLEAQAVTTVDGNFSTEDGSPVVEEPETETVETTITDIGGQRRADVTPEVGGIEPITMETDFQLPFENNANQTGCGETIRVQNGDRNWRIVIRAIFNLEQFRRLQQIRRVGDPSNVDVTTAEFGTITVDFDQISVARADDDVGEIDGVVGPLIEVQIQTKEQTEQESLFG